MSESTMRKNVLKWLKPWDAIPVENPKACPGTPDVNYLHGWIELKQLPEWPKGANTSVQIEHFTPQQRIWLKRRWRAGGGAWFLLQVKKDWLLFDGETAAKFVGRGLSKTELRTKARRMSAMGMSRTLIKSWLQQRTTD